VPGGSVPVLINNGDGSFAGPVSYDPGNAAYGPYSVAIGDLNGRGRAHEGGGPAGTDR